MAFRGLTLALLLVLLLLLLPLYSILHHLRWLHPMPDPEHTQRAHPHEELHQLHRRAGVLHPEPRVPRQHHGEAGLHRHHDGRLPRPVCRIGFTTLSPMPLQDQPVVVLLLEGPRSHKVLVIREYGGHEDLRGSGRRSVIPYIHG
jgi:hypothetical protein